MAALDADNLEVVQEQAPAAKEIEVPVAAGEEPIVEIEVPATMSALDADNLEEVTEA